MTTRFLCACHRQLVLADKTTAGNYWKQWVDKGMLLKEQGRYRDCVTYFGCAFEVADACLDEPAHCAEQLSRFTHSATLLASAYALINASDAGEQLLRYTRARIAEQQLPLAQEMGFELAGHIRALPLAVH